MILGEDHTHLMSCKKKFSSIGSHYYVSTSQESAGEQDKNFIGKIKTGKDNFRFNVYKKTQHKEKQIISTIVFSRKKGLKHI